MEEFSSRTLLTALARVLLIIVELELLLTLTPALATALQLLAPFLEKFEMVDVTALATWLVLLRRSRIQALESVLACVLTPALQDTLSTTTIVPASALEIASTLLSLQATAPVDLALETGR